MPIGNRIHLLSLAEREFRKETEAPQVRPAKRNFKALNVRLAKYGEDWDRKRGRAARMMGVILTKDAEQLHARICADDKTLKSYDGAADWLQSEARYLRKVATLQETAASRLTTVLAKCREERQVPPSP